MLFQVHAVARTPGWAPGRARTPGLAPGPAKASAVQGATAQAWPPGGAAPVPRVVRTGPPRPAAAVQHPAPPLTSVQTAREAACTACPSFLSEIQRCLAPCEVCQRSQMRNRPWLNMRFCPAKRWPS